MIGYVHGRITQMADGSTEAPASAFITSTKQTLGLRTADLLARLESLESRLRSLGGVSGDEVV